MILIVIVAISIVKKKERKSQQPKFIPQKNKLKPNIAKKGNNKD